MVQGDFQNIFIVLPIKDVPYLRKYHHSKMRMRPEMRLEVPVRAT